MKKFSLILILILFTTLITGVTCNAHGQTSIIPSPPDIDTNYIIRHIIKFVFLLILIIAISFLMQPITIISNSISNSNGFNGMFILVAIIVTFICSFFAKTCILTLSTIAILLGIASITIKYKNNETDIISSENVKEIIFITLGVIGVILAITFL